jgi:hypothetical protein
MAQLGRSGKETARFGGLRPGTAKNFFVISVPGG